MPRTEARVMVSIWRDGGFTALTERAQRLYLLLTSQATINLLGIVALTPGRWAGMASDSTLENLRTPLAELEAAGFILVDHDTDEVFVRTFLRHDGGWRSEKTRAAALGQMAHILSETLRDAAEVAIEELEAERKAREDGHDLPEGPSNIPSDSASDIPSDWASDRPRTRSRAVSNSDTDSFSVSNTRADPEELNLSLWNQRGHQWRDDGRTEQELTDYLEGQNVTPAQRLAAVAGFSVRTVG